MNMSIGSISSNGLLLKPSTKDTMNTFLYYLAGIHRPIGIVDQGCICNGKSYFREQGTNKVIELTFVNIMHFSAVMYPQKPERLTEMDNSMAKFPKVDSVRYFQATDFTHLH